jgi:hypothetical protein
VKTTDYVIVISDFGVNVAKFAVIYVASQKDRFPGGFDRRLIGPKSF